MGEELELLLPLLEDECFGLLLRDLIFGVGLVGVLDMDDCDFCGLLLPGERCVGEVGYFLCRGGEVEGGVKGLDGLLSSLVLSLPGT